MLVRRTYLCLLAQQVAGCSRFLLTISPSIGSITVMALHMGILTMDNDNHDQRDPLDCRVDQVGEEGRECGDGDVQNVVPAGTPLAPAANPGPITLKPADWFESTLSGVLNVAVCSFPSLALSGHAVSGISTLPSLIHLPHALIPSATAAGIVAGVHVSPRFDSSRFRNCLTQRLAPHASSLCVNAAAFGVAMAVNTLGQEVERCLVSYSHDLHPVGVAVRLTANVAAVPITKVAAEAVARLLNRCVRNRCATPSAEEEVGDAVAVGVDAGEAREDAEGVDVEGAVRT